MTVDPALLYAPPVLLSATCGAKDDVFVCRCGCGMAACPAHRVANDAAMERFMAGFAVPAE